MIRPAEDGEERERDNIALEDGAKDKDEEDTAEVAGVESVLVATSKKSKFELN